MEKEKNIPFKNYILLAVILIISAILIIYFYMWYSAYENNKLTTPIMDKYMQVINYNELDNYLIENKNCIIYSSFLENQEVREFELKFKDIIEKQSLKNSMLYLDLTTPLESEKVAKDLKEKYKYEDINITDSPSIMIFKEGQLVSMYSIKMDNYNIDNLEKYLIEEGIIYD